MEEVFYCINDIGRFTSAKMGMSVEILPARTVRRLGVFGLITISGFGYAQMVKREKAHSLVSVLSFEADNLTDLITVSKKTKPTCGVQSLE